jgi:hypothetical protein
MTSVSRRWAVAALVLLVATAHGPAAPGPKEKEPSFYFPWTVGDRLEFEVISDGKTHGGLVREVLEVEKKGRVLGVTASDNYGSGPINYKYGLSDAGVEMLTAWQVTFPTPKPLVRLPAKPEDTWMWQRGPSDPKQSFKTVNEEVVEVPAGKFKAVRVEMVAEDGTYTDWHVVGLGSVKREWSRPRLSDGVRVLKSFTSGKK